MLRRFLYLDGEGLRQYASMVDGGLTTQSTRTGTQSGHRKGGIDLKAASGERGSTTEDSRSTTFEDTNEARFDRLLTAAGHDPEALWWIDVVAPDTDLEGVGVGAIISWQCEVWIPQIVKALAPSGEFSAAIDLMRSMRSLGPVAQVLGLDMAELPSQDQMDAVQGLTQSLGAKTVIVGDDGTSSWKVTATVDQQWQSGELDGFAYVVGKVSRLVPAGHWQPLVTMPGLHLLSREQRRAQATSQPKAGEEDNYVAGPAAVLDLLAVYR